MPEQYERIKESYLKAGKPLATAKKLAAMTFNAHRKPGVAPVGPHSDEKMKPPKHKFKFRKPNEK
jgi:hypothetical protein